MLRTIARYFVNHLNGSLPSVLIRHETARAVMSTFPGFFAPGELMSETNVKRGQLGEAFKNATKYFKNMKRASIQPQTPQNSNNNQSPEQNQAELSTDLSSASSSSNNSSASEESPGLISSNQSVLHHDNQGPEQNEGAMSTELTSAVSSSANSSNSEESSGPNLSAHSVSIVGVACSSQTNHLSSSQEIVLILPTNSLDLHEEQRDQQSQSDIVYLSSPSASTLSQFTCNDVVLSDNLSLQETPTDMHPSLSSTTHISDTVLEPVQLFTTASHVTTLLSEHQTDIESSPNCPTEEQSLSNEEIEKMINFLKSAIGSEGNVKIALACTAIYRQNAVRDNPTGFVFEIFFRQPSLIVYDFNTIYPDKANHFFTKAQEVADTVKNIYDDLRGDFIPKSGYEMDELKPYLMILGLVNSYKSSFERHLFMLLGPNCSTGDLKRIANKQSHPFIIIQSTEPPQYFLSLDCRVIPLLQSEFPVLDFVFDLLYKVHHAFQIKYHPSLQTFFKFFDVCVYKMETKLPRADSKLHKLISKFNESF